MNARGLSLALLVATAAACGCDRIKKPSGPIGELSVEVVEKPGPDDKGSVVVTTKARPKTSVAVTLERPSPLGHRDSCFTKDADGCTVSIPIDKFRRYDDELRLPVKPPFVFVVEASADGVASVKKKITWARPSVCTPLPGSLDCEGLDDVFAEVIPDKGLAIRVQPWSETLTVELHGRTVTAPPGKTTLVPIDGSVVTGELLRKAALDATTLVRVDVPATIAGPKRKVFEGKIPVSVGGLAVSMGRALDQPMPWASNKKAMLVFRKSATGGKLVDVVGAPGTLLDVGLVGLVESGTNVEVACGTYTNKSTGATKSMRGSIEVVQVSIRELRSGKELRRKTIKAVGDPCRDTVKATTYANTAGAVVVGESTIRDYFRSAL